MLKDPALFQKGFHLSYFPMRDEIRELVRQENWVMLDETFKLLTSETGELTQALKRYHDFSSIEFIISIREANNEWEEDGIWHDDGSRVFAFSLSLTMDEIKGGRLGLRLIGEEEFTQIPTPGFGGIIMFLTGIYGFEHKIHKVTAGRRIIIAGWCT